MGPQGTRAAVQYLLTLQQTDDQLLLTLSVQSSIVATTIVAIIVVTIVAATTIVCYVLRPALRESNEHRTWLLQEWMHDFENQELPCRSWAEDVIKKAQTQTFATQWQITSWKTVSAILHEELEFVGM